MNFTGLSAGYVGRDGDRIPRDSRHCALRAGVFPALKAAGRRQGARGEIADVPCAGKFRDLYPQAELR